MIRKLGDAIHRRARLYQRSESIVTDYDAGGEIERQYARVTSKYIRNGTLYDVIEIASKIALVTVSHGARTYQFDTDSDYFTERKWHMEALIEDLA